MATTKKLTAKQQIWIDEYLKTWNATEAARRANYSIPRQQGSENLSKPALKAEIQRRLEESAMSADEALYRLGEIARGNLEDYFVFIDGVKQPYIDVQKAKENGKLNTLKKFRRDSDGKIDIELHDPQAAIDKILKAHGTYVSKHEVTGADGAPVIIKVNVKGADD